MKIQKNRATNRHSFKSGFTLVEIIIVMAIMTILFSMAASGLTGSRSFFTFTNSYERVVQLVREARSDAVTGKAQMDYTDYNQNGSTIDLVTPAGYGINFDTTAASAKVTLFVDLHVGALDEDQNEGVYDAPTSIGAYEAGKDFIMAQFSLDPSLILLLQGGPETVIYTPIFADVTFNPALDTGEISMIFGVSEGAAKRHKCSKIHPVSGVPEATTEAECPYIN
jgi:prepilin-type N-terminal cleavage/methylation domain-containing protein